ncbi:pectin acetylesterase-family hydrolase [Labilithrix luteola]|nr:pectin acetylesterase-family hydrolase [Labilithrix luteola]
MNDFICGNGNPSGIAINPSTSPTAPLLVFFMGGGACWDTLTCLGGTASNIAEDVGEANVMGDVDRVKALFDRTATENPFKDASFVFVPYCTGDLHAGDATKTYSIIAKSVTVHHNGSKNSDAVVKRLLATFQTPSKIYVTGASGGGYGAMFNVSRFQTAWPGFRVDLLDDCGPPIHPAGNTWQKMRASWNLQLPSGCTGCEDDASKILPYLAAQMPQARFALLDYTQDKTIRAFTGVLIPQDFENKLMALRAAAGPRQRMFFVAGDSHVLIREDPLPTSAGGLPLYSWLQRFASDDPAWDHEGP